MKLKKFLALTCSTLLLSSLFLGCGPKKDEEATQDKNNNVLYVYNWGDYIDPELLTKFKEETGIDVKYDVYDTNEIMYQKLNSGNVSYDGRDDRQKFVRHLTAENLRLQQKRRKEAVP